MIELKNCLLDVWEVLIWGNGSNHNNRKITNFDDINGITVPFTPGIRVYVTGILPGLRDRSVVPDVTFVRKDVGGKTDSAFLDVLKYNVTSFINFCFCCCILRPISLLLVKKLIV